MTRRFPARCRRTARLIGRSPGARSPAACAAQARSPFAPCAHLLHNPLQSIIAGRSSDLGERREAFVSALLDVRGLCTVFRAGDATVRAVDGVSYTVEQGETVAIVGESGSGKSVGAMSILRLIPDPPGRITGGQILFAGRDILRATDDEMRRIRGGDIGMVFQEPMTSLNPVLTIGRQITEAVYPRPRHPYTVSLLRSVPRLDRPRQARLDPVQGQPPDLTRLDEGCAFRPRCRFAVEACAKARPLLEPTEEPSHLAACFRSRDLAGLSGAAA